MTFMLEDSILDWLCIESIRILFYKWWILFNISFYLFLSFIYLECSMPRKCVMNVLIYFVWYLWCI